MAKHEASPNSEVTEHVSPESQNATSTYPGTRYGKGGHAPGTGDVSTSRIVTKKG